MKNTPNDFISQFAGKKLEKNLPPYFQHVTDTIMSTSNDKLMSSFVLEGCPFEAETEAELMQGFETVKATLVNIGKEFSSELAVWTHMVKRRERMDERYWAKTRFVQAFYDKYTERFTGKTFFRTTYHITLVLKNLAGEPLEDSIKRLETLNMQVMTALKPFQISALGIRPYGNAWCSDIAAFLHYLLNHEEVIIPLSHTDCRTAICDSEHIYGFDVAEIRPRTHTKSVFATGYLFRDFPKNVQEEAFNFLLSEPTELILTQSFIFIPQQASMAAADDQQARLETQRYTSTADLQEVALAKETLSRGDGLMTNYHAALVVYADTPKKALENGTRVASDFLTRAGGFRLLQAKQELPLVLLSMMPDSTRRPLASIRSTSVIACQFSAHNYSTGKKSGNPPGDGSAVIPFNTLADGLYWFNSHHSDISTNVTGQKYPGHWLLLGASGVGKTTLQSAVGMFWQRFNPMMFLIDFKESSHLAMKVFGGHYFTLEEGKSTGLQPFQLEETPSEGLRQFLYSLVGRCVSDLGQETPKKWLKDIKLAVDTVLMLPLELRRFSALLQDQLDDELRMRLEPWCENAGGQYAWALDSPENLFNPTEHTRVGFDTTAILKSIGGRIHPCCEVLLATLFHYKSMMQRKGRLMLTIVEEFWMPCNFPMTQAQIQDILKSGRLQNEFIWLISQSPEDAINCQIFAPIVQQTPTKTLLPNPDAKYEGYKEIGLTEKEFAQLKALPKLSRKFLVKQSGSSCFAKMDLPGFDDFMPILSGDTEGIELYKAVCEELETDDPDIWVPVFLTRLKELRSATATTPVNDHTEKEV